LSFHPADFLVTSISHDLFTDCPLEVRTTAVNAGLLQKLRPLLKG